MKTILSAAAAVAAMSLTTPALAFSVWPDIDFEWYANVGRSDTAPLAVQPAARPGYIWSPAHVETRGERQIQVAAHWVVDDYDTQLALYNHPEFVVVAR